MKCSHSVALVLVSVITVRWANCQEASLELHAAERNALAPTVTSSERPPGKGRRPPVLYIYNMIKRLCAHQIRIR